MQISHVKIKSSNPCTSQMFLNLLPFYFSPPFADVNTTLYFLHTIRYSVGCVVLTGHRHTQTFSMRGGGVVDPEAIYNLCLSLKTML